MPISYRYYRCEDAPVLGLEDSVRSQAQLAIDGWHGEAESSLTYVGRSDHADFEKYDCLHQVDRQVDAVFKDHDVKQLLFNVRFTAYYNRDEKYFLVQTGKKEARGFFSRLEKSGLNAEPGSLDLDLVSQLGPTTGGWFGNLKIDKVSSAGIFGSDEIVGSDEWSHYADVGVISALNMKLPSDAGVPQSVMVTKDRLVLLMQDLGENTNLHFVSKLNAEFDGFETV